MAEHAHLSWLLQESNEIHMGRLSNLQNVILAAQERL